MADPFHVDDIVHAHYGTAVRSAPPFVRSFTQVTA